MIWLERGPLWHLLSMCRALAAGGAIGCAWHSVSTTGKGLHFAALAGMFLLQAGVAHLSLRERETRHVHG